MDNVTLKFCPFCGGNGDVESGVEFYQSCGSEVQLKAVVRCKKCNCTRSAWIKATEDFKMVPFERYTEAFDRAIEMWNQRWEDGDVDCTGTGD